MMRLGKVLCLTVNPSMTLLGVAALAQHVMLMKIMLTWLLILLALLSLWAVVFLSVEITNDKARRRTELVLKELKDFL